jgi:hypothetical protein
MRKGGLIIAVGVLVALILVIVAVIPRSGPKVHPPSVSGGSEVLVLDRPALYCPVNEIPPPHGRVQILVDGSGSMKGVREPVLGYVRWLEQAISRLRDSALVVDELRVAQFDRRRHILSSKSVRAFEREFDPRGETTRHETSISHSS